MRYRLVAEQTHILGKLWHPRTVGQATACIILLDNPLLSSIDCIAVTCVYYHPKLEQLQGSGCRTVAHSRAQCIAMVNEDFADAGRLGVCYPEAGLAGKTEVPPQPTRQGVHPGWQIRPATAERHTSVMAPDFNSVFSQEAS